MQRERNKTGLFNKKWLLLAVIPLTAAIWKFTDDNTGGYYRRPLSLSTELAANFGEVRENHFHMGLDIRTNGKENLPVYAAADGYISRVTITEAGYGKALYVTHPNNTITVYAHLNHFMDGVEKAVRAKQYQDECWQQEIHFTPGEFTVNKGDQIALSGNTGTTEGPHLHFEIRDAVTGCNINPLFNGFNVTDHIAPVINGLYWYNKTGSIYNAKANKINLRGEGDEYTSSEQTITVNTDKICFGIDVADKSAEGKFRLGMYKALLYVDGVLKCSFAVNRFNARDTRYVNACIDYAAWVRYSKCIQLLCILPGNNLPVFEGSPGNGVIKLADKKTHNIKIVVGDAAGNTTAVSTTVKYDGDVKMESSHPATAQRLLPNKANHVTTPNARVYFSSKALYDTVAFNIKEETNNERNNASAAIFLHDATVPVHDSLKVQIKTTLPLGSPLRAHTVILLTNEKHSLVIKGKWIGDFMEGYCMELGTVQLIIDTISPVVNLKEGNNAVFTETDKALHVLYNDNLGEAAFFRAELDGHWLLFEKKGDCFTYYFDEHCHKGKHRLKIIAGDKAGNITSQVFTFIEQ